LAVNFESMNWTPSVAFTNAKSYPPFFIEVQLTDPSPL